MKTMKIIQFDIALREQIQSEENGYKGRYKVQTRVGNDVRIICWDKIDKRDKPYPIAGLRTVDDTEFITTWMKDGKFASDAEYHINDLVLVDTWEPKFELWDRIKSRVTGVVFDVVSIDYVSKKYGVISDNAYADRSCVMFYEQDDFELVKPVSGFNYLEGIVMRCAEGPNKGSLWLKCCDRFVKSDGVTVSHEGLYYSATMKEATHFFAELDKNGYKWSSILGSIAKKPKFKIGDIVRYKNSDGKEYMITDMLEAYYQTVQYGKSNRLISFEHDDRLELVPKEPELTDFEKELANCFYKSIVVRNIETFAKECAPKLIALAKKEVTKKPNED